MKHILISLFTCLLTLAANAAEVSDSLSRALATYWGSAVKVKDMTPAQVEQFTKGMEESLAAENDSVRQAYIQGVLYGMRLQSSLKDMETLGLKADAAAVGPYVAQVIKGADLGFTQSSAQHYLDGLISGAQQVSAESEAKFVADEGAKPGAVTTPTGLVFQTISEGAGTPPTKAQKVKISYVARLSNGEIFDSTDEPVVFDLINLIPGFSEGLQMMKPGGKYRLVIPSQLGYGEHGAGGVIPPGAALDFTVELLSIED